MLHLNTGYSVSGKLSLVRNKNFTFWRCAKTRRGKKLSKITKVELNANTITLYFTINEHDVNAELTKKDEDHAAGNAMGMFDTEAERVKTTN